MTTTAREYLRVSVDKSGLERSPAEQHADNECVAAEHGWQLGDPYRDVGSASRYANGNGRPGFGRLVADLEAGRFGAGVLVLWEASRGSRRLSEWARTPVRTRSAGVDGHRSAATASWMAAAAASASEGCTKTENVESPSPLVRTISPPDALTASRISAS